VTAVGLTEHGRKRILDGKGDNSFEEFRLKGGQSDGKEARGVCGVRGQDTVCSR
jgi:hypothetical protein